MEMSFGQNSTISFSPGFSPVFDGAAELMNRFNGFLR